MTPSSLLPARFLGMLIILGFASWMTSASGAIRNWTGPAAGGRWTDTANWTDSTLPLAGDDVVVGDPNVAVTVDVPVVVRSLTLATGTQLKVQGGNFEVTGDWVVPAAAVRVSSNAVLRAASVTRLDVVDFVLESGARLELPALVDLGSSTFDVSGGAQFEAPPTVVSVDCRRPGFGGSYYAPVPLFRARGEGSVLDLHTVGTIALAADAYLGVEALEGGVVDLSGCTSFAGRSWVISARTQGQLRFDRLAVLDGVFPSTVGIVNVGVARQAFPSLGVLNHFALQLFPDGIAGGAVLALPQVVELANGSLAIPDHAALETPLLERLIQTDVVLSGSGTLGVAALRSVERSTFDLAGGARLALPAVIDRIQFERLNFGGADYAPVPLFRVRGAGSLLDLRSIRSIVSNSAGYVALEAAEGGELDLSQCESLVGQHFVVSVRSLGRWKGDRLAVIDAPVEGLQNQVVVGVERQEFPRLETLRNSVVKLLPEGVAQGATLAVPALIEMSDSSLDLPDHAVLHAPVLQRLTGADVVMQGTGTITGDALQLVDGSTFDLRDGAHWTMPAAIGRFDYRRPTGSGFPSSAPPLFRARGVGSRLDLRALRLLAINSAAYMAIAAQDGGEVDLGRCEVISGAYLAVRQASGGVLRLDALTDLQCPIGVQAFSLSFEAAQFDLPSLRFARGLQAGVSTAGRLFLGGGEVVAERCSFQLEELGEIVVPRLWSRDSQISGSGVWYGDVVNEGVIDPGQVQGADTGVLTLRGNLLSAPGATGKLHVDLAARSDLLQDRLVVEGRVELGQGVELSRQGGYVPSPGDSVVPLEWGLGASGQLAQIEAAALPGGLEWVPEIEASSLRLTTGPGKGPVVLATSPVRNAALPFTRWQVVFNEAIQPSSIPASAVRLFGPDNQVLGPTTVLRQDPRTYEVTWTPVTQPGTYRIELAETIRDLAGFALGQTFSVSLTLAGDGGATNGIVIVGPPVAQRVGPGGGVAFSVTAQGVEPLRYQWYKNGTVLTGETRATLVIPRADPADAGNYTVVVANEAGQVESVPVRLEVVLPEVLMADRFADRPVYTSPSFVGVTDTTAAGNEAGEPRHADKVGGKSVWLTWRAPANGVVTFTTAGSSFDTLMAVYRGSELSQLKANEVAHDEDSGGFLTSRVRFTAVAGTDYQVAVDGYAGASGQVVLGWNLEVDEVPLPVITQPPRSLLERSGIVTAISVQATGTNLRFQWYKDGSIVAGATQATLAFPNLQNADAGAYVVGVRSGTGPEVRSDPASVQVVQRGPASTGLQDKLEEFLQADLAGPNRSEARLSGPGASGFASVAFGVPGGLAVNNVEASRQAGEALPCAVAPDGGTLWWRLRPNRSGELTLDTFGSRVDTVVSIFRGLQSRAPVGCNDDANPTDGTSELRVEVAANEDYFVQVDSINGRGVIVLNWKLGGGTVETPVVRLLAGVVGEALEIRFQVNPGRYRVEVTADLAHWELVNEGTSQGAETTVRVPVQVGIAGAFYRVVVP